MKIKSEIKPKIIRKSSTTRMIKPIHVQPEIQNLAA